MKKYTFFLLCLFVFVAFGCKPKQEKTPVFEKPLTQNWHIAPAASVAGTGQELSVPGFEMANWHKTNVPTTVLHALVQNGVYENPYFGMNIKKIPPEKFQQAFWYRTEFELSEKQASMNALLRFDGINYRANIFLNGEKIAGKDKIFGAFRQFQLKVSQHLKAGKNALAVQVFPPQPGDFTIGFVDWNPAPPDQNMGLWREVKLCFNRGVALHNPFVQSKINLETLDEAWLTVSAELENLTENEISGELCGKIENIEFSQAVSLKPGARKEISFLPEKFDQLHLKNPRLWWCNGMGKPELYDMKIYFTHKGKVSDSDSVSFGIRQVEDYLTTEGFRGYKLNGKKVLLKGGGWVDDLLLGDSPESTEAQIRYAKHLNMNTIRMEGFWGKSRLPYELCDRYGILLMVGWSCHWEWAAYVGKEVDEFGAIKTPDEMQLIAQSLRDQVLWLRNRPSVFVWAVGSDKLPRPALEKKYVNVFEQTDPTRPYLAAAKEQTSEISGQTGAKMRGPYAYTPPVYWYSDTLLGGAFGLNTETGPGAQVPPLSSIKKMIPQQNLWPPDSVWDFHCGRHAFGTLSRYIKAMNKRYGEAQSTAEFAMKAQALNYELMRPMFEAFRANKFRATGVIQWMFNSAWPEMYWQLYDSYLMPNGAFYGAKKACEPLHLIYDYQKNSIVLANALLEEKNDLKARIRVFDLNAKPLFSKEMQAQIGENDSKQLLQLPEINSLTSTYFLKLELFDETGNKIDDNFYWLSTQEDELDYQAQVKPWNFYTPSKKYADFTALNSLPKVKTEAQVQFSQTKDSLLLSLKNTSDHIAFLVEFQIVGQESGEAFLPVFWSDNYICLLPGETRKLTATFDPQSLEDETPKIEISGWNLDRLELVSGARQ